MNPPPPGWPRIAPAVFYDDAGAALDWLCRAFGFEVRLRIDGDGGRVEHSELAFADGVVMLASAGGGPDRPDRERFQSPRALGGASTQSLSLFVDDVDAHCERARAAGARIVEDPHTADYGDEWGSLRSYRAEDPEGHQWCFLRQVRPPAANG